MTLKIGWGFVSGFELRIVSQFVLVSESPIALVFAWPTELVFDSVSVKQIEWRFELVFERETRWLSESVSVKRTESRFGLVFRLESDSEWELRFR